MALLSAFLLIPQSDGSTQEFHIQTDHIVLGRAIDCDVVLPGRLISRHHASIQCTGQVYTLQDLGSHNGTTVNGQTFSGSRVLYDGDWIELGGMSKICFVDSDSTMTRLQPPAVGIWLEPATQDVWVDGQRLVPQVSPIQFALLQILTNHHDQVCSRTQIIAAVWPDTRDGISDESIDSLIKRVRMRLGEVRNGQSYIETRRGRGFILHSSLR